MNFENIQIKLTEDTLQSGGPVILGIAATNRPHLALPPMSIVEIEGKEMIRVPFIRSGIFRHPNGKLIFNEQTMNTMLDNFVAKKSHYGVSLDVKHMPKLGALAWFDRNGGFIRLERDPEYGSLLVGYGAPTSQEGLNLVKNGSFQYASVEFHPNHKPNMVKQLSADDISEISVDEIMLEYSENDLVGRKVIDRVRLINPFSEKK